METLKLQPGMNYIMSYGIVKKLAMFIGEKDGAYNFRDDHGPFIFTAAYLAKGKVRIEEIEEEWTING